MTSIKLFSPLHLREITFRNRSYVSPMCQYSSEPGHLNMSGQDDIIAVQGLFRFHLGSGEAGIATRKRSLPTGWLVSAGCRTGHSKTLGNDRDLRLRFLQISGVYAGRIFFPHTRGIQKPPLPHSSEMGTIPFLRMMSLPSVDMENSMYFLASPDGTPRVMKEKI